MLAKEGWIRMRQYEEEYRGFSLCEGCEGAFLLPMLKESHRQNLLNKLHAAKWQKFSLA
jgi:hypothetical protein